MSRELVGSGYRPKSVTEYREAGAAGELRT